MSTCLRGKCCQTWVRIQLKLLLNCWGKVMGLKNTELVRMQIWGKRAPVRGLCCTHWTSDQKDWWASEEAFPCSASLRKEISSCCRKNIKPHPDSPCLPPLHNKSQTAGRRQHTILLRAVGKSSSTPGEEAERKQNKFSFRRGARIWNGLQNCPLRKWQEPTQAGALGPRDTVPLQGWLLMRTEYTPTPTTGQELSGHRW